MTPHPFPREERQASATFEARTRLGILIKIFEDRQLALKWWDERSCEFPRCSLDEVQTVITVTRRAIRKPRLELVR